MPPNPTDADPVITDGPIHEWFGLSYASYLVVPRTVLQSMSDDWQARLIALMDELNKTIDWMPEGCGYDVGMLDQYGDPTIDPNADYERGRRRLPTSGPIGEITPYALSNSSQPSPDLIPDPSRPDDDPPNPPLPLG